MFVPQKHSKGGRVNPLVYISSKFGQGGRGEKIQKLCVSHKWMLPHASGIRQKLVTIVRVKKVNVPFLISLCRRAQRQDAEGEPDVLRVQVRRQRGQPHQGRPPQECKTFYS